MKAKGFDALNMEFGKNEIDTSQLSIEIMFWPMNIGSTICTI